MVPFALWGIVLGVLTNTVMSLLPQLRYGTFPLKLFLGMQSIPLLFYHQLLVFADLACPRTSRTCIAYCWHLGAAWLAQLFSINTLSEYAECTFQHTAKEVAVSPRSALKFREEISTQNR